jgi:hypothetical protein
MVAGGYAQWNGLKAIASKKAAIKHVIPDAISPAVPWTSV